ncbi:MAG: hypothetical protein ACRYFS_17275 [Janthinobacterium lividum]
MTSERLSSPSVVASRAGELIAANTDERDGAQELLDSYRNLCVLGDKGFLDQHQQAFLWEEQGLLLVTPKRKNQKAQNARSWDATMNRAWRQIELSTIMEAGVAGIVKKDVS